MTFERSNAPETFAAGLRQAALAAAVRRVIDERLPSGTDLRRWTLIIRDEGVELVSRNEAISRLHQADLRDHAHRLATHRPRGVLAVWLESETEDTGLAFIPIAPAGGRHA